MKTWLVSFLLVSFGLGLATTGVAAPGKTNPVREDLKHVGKDLRRQQRLYKRLQRESTSLLEALSDLGTQVDDSERELSETEARLTEVERELASYRKQREQASRSVGLLRTRLRGRLRQMYMQGEVGWLNLVFGADSLSEGLQRHELLKQLAIADEKLAREVAHSRDRLAETERRIEERKLALEEVRAQVEGRRQAAAAARDENMAALELIDMKSGLRKRAVSELKHARGRLSSLVSSMEGKTTKATKGFASWHGRLPPPVAGGRLEAGFGRQVDDRFGTVTKHPGLDIRVARGTQVKAVYPGKVAFSDVFQGYGRLVILEHGGGYYTLYGHLLRLSVAKGDRVEQGQAIGAVGDSGSLKGDYLYFEVRKGGRAVDPQKWVRF
jgi:septal ring factor EnvC (AmiA/AmiB activator)